MAPNENPVYESNLADMTRRHAAMLKSLNNPALSSQTLHVDAFKRDFLPYFAGTLPFSQDVLNAWLHVAGDAFKPVNLVNFDQQVVAVVPALKVSTLVNPLRADRRDNPDAHTVMVSASPVRQLAPASADAKVQNGLIERFKPTIYPTPESLKRAWMDLFTYFGLSIVEPGSTAPIIAKKPELPTLEVGDEY